MKRMAIVAAVLAAVMALSFAVAQAYGPAWGGARGDYAGGPAWGSPDETGWAGGFQGGGRGPGYMGRNRAGGPQMGPGFGPGWMGPGAGGPGMMGPGYGRGGGGCLMGGAPGAPDGSNYDPAAMLEHALVMLERHEERLAVLQERLSQAQEDGSERLVAWLTGRMELQTIQLDWLTSRIPVLESLPEAWLEGAIALAEHDVAFFSGVTAEDERTQAWVDQRLTMAEQRLEYLLTQLEQDGE